MARQLSGVWPGGGGVWPAILAHLYDAGAGQRDNCIHFAGDYEGRSTVLHVWSRNVQRSCSLRSFPVGVVRSDSGKSTANISEILGRGSAAAISVFYYPSNYQTFSEVPRDGGPTLGATQGLCGEGILAGDPLQAHARKEVSHKPCHVFPFCHSPACSIGKKNLDYEADLWFALVCLKYWVESGWIFFRRKLKSCVCRGAAAGTEVEFWFSPLYPKQLKAMFPQLAGVKVVQALLAGVDWTLDDVPPGGLTVCDAQGCHNVTTSEWVLMAILTRMKYVPIFVQLQAEQNWRGRTRADAAYQKLHLLKQVTDPPILLEELSGKNVLIVGYGRSGARLKRGCRHLKWRLYGWRGMRARALSRLRN